MVYGGGVALASQGLSRTDAARRGRAASTAVVLAIVVGGGAATAQEVPPHLASMAGQLVRALSDDLGAADADTARGWGLRRAETALDRQKMTRWSAANFRHRTLLPALAEALELADLDADGQARAEPLLPRLLRSSAPEVILEILAALGRPAPDDEGLAAMKRAVDAALAAAWKDLPRRHEMAADGPERVSLEWRPREEIFEIGVEDAGDAFRAPFRTTLRGRTQARAGASGALELAVAPAAEPVDVQDWQDLLDEPLRIFGHWRDQDGRRWIILPPDGADAPPAPPAAAGTGPSPAERIAAKAARIAEIKASRVYVWENPETGERIEQARFKRLDMPWEWGGQHYAVADAEAEIERLEAEIAELEAGGEDGRPALADAPPPLPEPTGDGRVAAVIITSARGDGSAFAYDSAVRIGERLEARRTLREARDIINLPPDVVAQLVEAWSPPEWIELRAGRDAETGEAVLSGEVWRLHVTYDGFSHKVDSIHTPYAKPLRLSRPPSKGP